MRVDGGGDADVGVAEKFLDHHQLNPLLQEQGGGRVPKVVETDAAETSLAEEHGEGAREVGRVDRTALRRGEHVPVLSPSAASDSECELLVTNGILPADLVTRTAGSPRTRSGRGLRRSRTATCRSRTSSSTVTR